MKTAYLQGAEWLAQVMAYIEENYRFMEAYLREHLPQIKPVQPEGTYLIWLDCQELGIEDEKLNKFVFDEAWVYLDEGTVFGPEGSGFMRMNIACPRAILAEASVRMQRVLG